MRIFFFIFISISHQIIRLFGLYKKTERQPMVVALPQLYRSRTRLEGIECFQSLDNLGILRI